MYHTVFNLWLIVDIFYPCICLGYNRPTPPRGSGPHRYFLFLSEQPYEKTEFNYALYQNRAKFNPDRFIEQYNFSPAIGTSYFVTEDQ